VHSAILIVVRYYSTELAPNLEGEEEQEKKQKQEEIRAEMLSHVL